MGVQIGPGVGFPGSRTDREDKNVNARERRSTHQLEAVRTDEQTATL